MSKVRDLQYVNGKLCYRGYSISQVMCVGGGCYGHSTFDFTLVEETLENLLDLIDYRLDNSLTSKEHELGESNV